MKTVLVMFVLLVAFVATVSSADLNFSDLNVWKISTNSSSALKSSYLVAKYKNNVYINSYIYDAISMNAFAGICPGRIIRDLVRDKSEATWVATDSGVVRQSPTDTTVYLIKQGLPSNDCRSICYDADSNRIIVGTYLGVSVTKLDANSKATSWTNSLSDMIHQIAVRNGEIWAISNDIVYRYVSGNWIEYAQFLTPMSGDIDAGGSFWLSFQRRINGTLISERGLAKFDGQNWTPYFVDTAATSYFGKIRIDKHNTLWFTGGDDPGYVDLATMTVNRSGGSLVWAPAGQNLAISIKDDGEVIYAGSNAWVEKISTSAVRNPIIARNLPRGITKVVGAFDLSGRKISSNSFSAHSSSGLRITATRNQNEMKAAKTISTR